LQTQRLDSAQLMQCVFTSLLRFFTLILFLVLCYLRHGSIF